MRLITDKKTYCGHYKGIDVYGIGSMIGNNWYGTYYAVKKKNGRNYKVKDSECSTIEQIKDYINRHIEELKERK